MPAKLARTGAALDTARAAVIFVHGRGATAESILTLADEIAPDETQDLAFLAPQAPGNAWYPYSFLAPIAQNEPYLSNALQSLADLFTELEKNGLPPERVALVGFSQGACLSLEFVARHTRRYGGVAGLSGGLIGPQGIPRSYPGNLSGTPVFLGCSDVDPHIPKARVHESAQVLEHLGGQVTARIYPGMGHTVNEDELDFLQGMIERLRTTSSVS
jgi:phospholipase/carboxylesterase